MSGLYWELPALWEEHGRKQPGKWSCSMIGSLVTSPHTPTTELCPSIHQEEVRAGRQGRGWGESQLLGLGEQEAISVRSW